jgi:hypothetical protein
MKQPKIKLNLLRHMDAIAATVLFANLRPDELAKASLPRASQREGHTKADLARYEQLQTKIRYWLEALLRKRMSAKEKTGIETEIDELLVHPALTIEFSLAGGQLSAMLHLDSSLDEFSVGYGAALLFDEKLGYRKHLRQCQLDSCRRFFVHFDKGGKAYCSAAHSLRMRQQAFKKRQRQLRGR